MARTTTPFVTWHGHDLPLCKPTDGPVTQWPVLPLAHICVTLAHIPRFNAAQRGTIEGRSAWSVAQHLLLCGIVAKRLEPNNSALLAAALTHDLHEAFIGDIISPVLWALDDKAQAQVKELKEAVDAQLVLGWGINGAPHAICLAHAESNYAIVDRLALMIERAAFIQWDSSMKDWFKDAAPEEAMNMVVSIAASADFATLRAYSPTAAARELDMLITKTAKVFF